MVLLACALVWKQRKFFRGSSPENLCSLVQLAALLCVQRCWWWIYFESSSVVVNLMFPFCMPSCVSFAQTPPTHSFHSSSPPKPSLTETYCGFTNWEGTAVICHSHTRLSCHFLLTLCHWCWVSLFPRTSAAYVGPLELMWCTVITVRWSALWLCITIAISIIFIYASPSILKVIKAFSVAKVQIHITCVDSTTNRMIGHIFY